jgi:hypothetical protein
VHYPVDSAAGAVLGIALARYLAARCQGSEASCHSWHFDAATFCDDEPDGFFDHAALVRQMDIADGPTINPPLAEGPAVVAGLSVQARLTLGSSGILAWLWQKALAEWA